MDGFLVTWLWGTEKMRDIEYFAQILSKSKKGFGEEKSGPSLSQNMVIFTRKEKSLITAQDHPKFKSINWYWIGFWEPVMSMSALHSGNFIGILWILMLIVFISVKNIERLHNSSQSFFFSQLLLFRGRQHYVFVGYLSKCSLSVLWICKYRIYKYNRIE